MTKLEQLILLILDRAHKMEIEDLSSFQLFKIPYLLQVLSLKYAGTELLAETKFIREKNGPISINIYSAIESLEKSGHIKSEIHENPGYFDRKAHKLGKKLPRLEFSKGEVIFLDNFLSELLPLTQKQLKEYAYSTEPMAEILKEENGGDVKKGTILDFSKVTVDPDVVDAYAEA